MAIAFLVEFADRVCVFRRAEEQLQRGDLALKETAQRCEVSHHAAVEHSDLTLHFGGDICSLWPIPSRTWLQVEVGSAVQQFAYFLLQGSHLALNDLGSLHLPLRTHLREDGRQVVASDLLEATLSEVLDELHDFNAEAVSLDPQTELGMLSTEAPKQLQKHVVDLLPEVGKFLRTQVRIIVDEPLHLGPEGLLAALMKEAALVAGLEAGLADESGLAAVRISANCEHRLAVDALRTVQLPLRTHIIYDKPNLSQTNLS